jgi:hypothetical protein
MRSRSALSDSPRGRGLKGARRPVEPAATLAASTSATGPANPALDPLSSTDVEDENAAVARLPYDTGAVGPPEPEETGRPGAPTIAQSVPLRQALRNLVRARRLTRKVFFADLRHDDKQVHRAEGYGGKPIEAFPPFRFYLLRETGHREQAYEQFRAWYHEQFDRYMRTEKSVGGMKNGSLYRLVVAFHERTRVSWSDPAPAFRRDLVDRAIEQRVEERFQLLDSIKQRGYVRSSVDPVVGVARDDRVYLSSGHHRAAALRAIRSPSVPGVLVLSPTARRVLRGLRIA